MKFWVQDLGITCPTPETTERRPEIVTDGHVAEGCRYRLRCDQSKWEEGHCMPDMKFKVRLISVSS